MAEIIDALQDCPHCGQTHLLEDIPSCPMSPRQLRALIDQKQLSEIQRAELYDDGILCVIDERTHQEIKLDIKAGARLYELMHFHDHLADLYQEIE